MKQEYFIFCLIVSFFLTGCVQDLPVKKEIKLNPELENLSWIIGTWTSVNDKTHYQETWVKMNNFTLSGKAFMLDKTDTVFTEKLQIIVLDKDVFYIAAVPGQNNGLPVRFKMTKNIRGLHIFENTTHDFPQKIIYLMRPKNQLFASVSGFENGKFRKEDFLLNRVGIVQSK